MPVTSKTCCASVLLGKALKFGVEFIAMVSGLLVTILEIICHDEISFMTHTSRHDREAWCPYGTTCPEAPNSWRHNSASVASQFRVLLRIRALRTRNQIA